METLKLLLFVIAWTLFGLLAAHFANKRGRNPYPWFFIGFFLGVIGLILLFVLPKIEKKEEKKPIKPLTPPPLPETLWYYLDSEHKQHGPVSQTWLTREISEGRLNENTLVWNESIKNWTKVKDLKIDL